LNIDATVVLTDKPLGKVMPNGRGPNRVRATKGDAARDALLCETLPQTRAVASNHCFIA
jgi:hypothetical protein